jgi:leucyl-tRNA synthetase
MSGGERPRWRHEDTPVERDSEQWFLKITDYAERLLNDMRTWRWPDACSPCSELDRQSVGTFVDFK